MRISVRVLIPAIIVISVLCLALLFLEVQTKVIRRARDNFLFDNWNHYLPCEELPTEIEVREVVEAHQQLIQEIERVNPGLVGVEINASVCAGKADIVIWYASHQNRLAIEKILDSDTFHGVPYRLQNR